MSTPEQKGCQIIGIEDDSPAKLAGLMNGDTLLTINGNQISDVLDLMYHSQSSELNMLVKRKGASLELKMEKEEFEATGLNLKEFKVRHCSNRCLFCFVSQLPKGLRKSLYIKDEDFRLSFQYGSYLTLSNLTKEDKERIVRQRLSPLYVSVHSTNNDIRRELLRNKEAPDILKEIRYLTKEKIKLHTQIVLCPGYNDGGDLEKTINDLAKFYPYIASIAVVPVGLTSHANKKIRPLGKDDAISALDTIERIQKRLQKKYGDLCVYGADELYIKAQRHFPALKNYGDLPQVENGVGLVPLFIERSRRFRRFLHVPASRIFTFTGQSFYPFFSKIIAKLVAKYHIDLTLIPVENLFFGNSVTVTGLLSGRDIIRSLMGKTGQGDVLLIPDVTLRDGDNVFLDDLTVDFVSQSLHVSARVIESTFDGLIHGLTGVALAEEAG